MEEGGASSPQDEQVRPLVVVVVPRHRAGRALLRVQAPHLGHVGEAALLVVVEPLSLRPDGVDVQGAVAVEVEHGDGAGQGGPCVGHGSERAAEGGRDRRSRDRGRGREDAGRHIDEARRRRLRVDELGLRAGGRQRLRVAPLLGVVLADERPVAALAQHAEALQHLLAFLRLAGADEREAEVVDGGGVVGLGRHRGLEPGHRLVVLARLQVQLAEVDQRGDVGGIDRKDLLEGRLRLVDAVLPPRDQAEDVMGLRKVGPRLRGGPRFALGAREVGRVEERDREVGAGDRERGIHPQRLAKRLGRVRGPELLEQRHPPVVGAIRILAYPERRRPGPNE